VRLMRKLLKKQGFAPDVLRSYASARRELGLSARHEQGLRKTIGPRTRTFIGLQRIDGCSTKDDSPAKTGELGHC
jgi:hypothetical protein